MASNQTKLPSEDATLDVPEVLRLLEQRGKERRGRVGSKIAATPEERITAQIDASVADELDSLITAIRAKLPLSQK